MVRLSLKSQKNDTRQYEKMIKEINAYLDSKRDETLKFLKTLIDQKGGSGMTTAVNSVGSLIAAELPDNCFSLEKIPDDFYGDHLLFTNHQNSKAITLIGHTETTFTDYSHLPEFRVDGDKVIGPGTCDMLGGIVVFVYALKCIHHLGKLNGIPLTLFFNTDEERGASTSKEMLKTLASKASFALVSESAGSEGEIVVGRRGKMSFDIISKGVEGHAGNLSGQKSSAIEEIAHKILAIEALNKNWEGADINAGLITGGIASNTIAGKAVLSSDIRYAMKAHEQEIKSAIFEIANKNHVNACSSELRITSERPLWENTSDHGKSKEFVTLISECAKKLNHRIGTELRKGTSDANFFGAAGVPTADGFGPVGFHDHTNREYILLETLYERIKLCALTLLNLKALWRYSQMLCSKKLSSNIPF